MHVITDADQIHAQEYREASQRANLISIGGSRRAQPEFVAGSESASASPVARVMMSAMRLGSDRPLGRVFAIGICILIGGVLAGVIGVAVAAKRQQRYRVLDDGSRFRGDPSSNAASPASPATLQAPAR